MAAVSAAFAGLAGGTPAATVMHLRHNLATGGCRSYILDARSARES
jgi:hypothetical protein